MTYNVFSGTLNPTHFTSSHAFDVLFNLITEISLYPDIIKEKKLNSLLSGFPIGVPHVKYRGHVSLILGSIKRPQPGRVGGPICLLAQYPTNL